MCLRRHSLRCHLLAPLALASLIVIGQWSIGSIKKKEKRQNTKMNED
jgi:hypothetical protein